MDKEHFGRQAFRDVIERPEDEIDLVEAALAVAQEDLDVPDVEATRLTLKRLAQRTAEQIGPLEHSVDYAERLVRYLHEMEGFGGNTTNYDDPTNSYLPLVCENRTGLPITLTLVLLAVAQEIGVPLEPAGLPAHFMARWPLPGGNLFLDLFFGQVLDGRSCRTFLQAQQGTALPDPDLFPAASPREVIARLLNNLKHSYVRRANFPRALAATERILLLVPDSIEDIRDRGFLRIRTGDLHRGLYDLDHYAQQEPTSLSQMLIRKQAQTVTDLILGRN